MDVLLVLTFLIMLGAFFLMISGISDDNDGEVVFAFALVFSIIMITFVISITKSYVEDYYKLGWIDGKTGGQQYELISNPDSTKTWEKK